LQNSQKICGLLLLDYVGGIIIGCPTVAEVLHTGNTAELFLSTML